jgi:hypothetical protein
MDLRSSVFHLLFRGDEMNPKTIKVEHPEKEKDFMIINEEDFNAEIHMIFEEPKKESKKEKEPKKEPEA